MVSLLAEMGTRAEDFDEDPPERALPMKHALPRVRDVFRRADAAYARFSCPASADCCQLTVTKRQPWVWEPEYRVLEASGVTPRPRTDGGCPYLDDAGKRCRAYAARPLGCRTFFCERGTGGRHPLELTTQLSLELERIAKEVNPDAEPRELLEWFPST